MMIRNVLTVIAATIVLAGCSAFEGNSLGETRIETEFQGNSVERIRAAGPLVEQMKNAGLTGQEVRAVFAAVTRPLPARMTLYDGKDKATIDWSVDVAEGTATYSASEVVATDPAEVKSKIAEAAGDDAVQAIERAFPGGVSGLIETLSKAGAL